MRAEDALTILCGLVLLAGLASFLVHVFGIGSFLTHVLDVIRAVRRCRTNRRIRIARRKAKYPWLF